jgi:hypothetical protein
MTTPAPSAPVSPITDPPSPGGPTSGAAVAPTALVSAWQGALAAEHAAVYGYAELGPLVQDGDVALARRYEAGHRDVRDTTSAALVGAGVVPVASLGTYPLPFAVTSAASAQRWAMVLEEQCAAAWRFLLATAASSVSANVSIRTVAAKALTDSAIRAMRWRVQLTPGTPTVAFPGI